LTQKAQMAKNSKIPNIISGIASAIVLIVASWLIFSAFWFWVFFEIAAALLVATGCSGEWWLHHHPAGRKKQEKDEHHKLESRFIASVVFGVTMELFALGHSIKEGVKLENAVESEKVQVAAIGTTNAQLVSDNLVLQSNVNTLALQLMETSNNVANANPRNQPLKSLSAVVTLVVLTGKTRENPLSDPIISANGWNLLTLRIMADNGLRIELHQDTVPPPPMLGDIINAEATTETIVLHLSGNEELQEPYMRQWNRLVGQTNLTAGQIAGLNFKPELQPSFLRGGTVVNGGEVRIWFNSPEVERRFVVPPQRIMEPPLSLVQCFPTPETNAPTK